MGGRTLLSEPRAAEAGDIRNALPQDWQRATLLGRLDLGHGPTPVLLRDGGLADLSHAAPTVSQLLNRFEPGVALPAGTRLADLDQLGLAPGWAQPDALPRLLAP